jgi:hypothetical protein
LSSHEAQMSPAGVASGPDAMKDLDDDIELPDDTTKAEYLVMMQLIFPDQLTGTACTEPTFCSEPLSPCPKFQVGRVR